MNDYIEWMALSQLEGIGPAGFWRIVEYFGTPGAALGASMESLRKLPGMRSTYLNGFARREDVLRSCIQQHDILKKMGAGVLTCMDSEYPQLLLEIKDPPPVLYLLGDRTLLNGCCLGMVGSRSATSYGFRTAFALAGKLAGKGVTIVSGLALGIDAQSHQGALAAGGKTIAVLGCGIDVIYPRQNTKLFEQIADQGAIISENPPATLPEGFRFPARNRIIAGMSRGVLVVEAARKSGSLITAQMALDEGRDVFAVPGQVDSCKSEGTHWLLQQGAKLVHSERDVLEELPAHLFCPADGRDRETLESSVVLEPEALQLLALIEPYPCSRDDLFRRSGHGAAEFSELLLILEIEGRVEILPGDEVRRIGPHDSL